LLSNGEGYRFIKCTMYPKRADLDTVTGLQENNCCETSNVAAKEINKRMIMLNCV